jgi:hypothetical protein
MKRAMCAALGAVLFGLAGPASAHHSLSVFERQKTVTVTGIVKDFAWGTPHVWIEIVSDSSDGMVINWNIEASSPTILARSGWRPSVLKPGDRVSVGVYPRKDGRSGGYLADAEPLVVNGRTLISGLGGNSSADEPTPAR